MSSAAAFAAILTTAFAGPMSYQPRYADISCARRCTDTSKFNYIPGTTYEFDYNITTQTAMEGANSDRAGLTIRATADIEVLSKCDMALLLRYVKVYRSKASGSMQYADDSGEFRKALERFPLRFSFQDGVVEEVCPSQGETTWALNIKRGFLTAVQNSMDNIRKDQTVSETDVTGECSTDYKVMSEGWYSTNIKKTKDLLGCTDRNGYRSSVKAVPYRVPSEIQSIQLVKSTHECEQELDRIGILKSALIKEIHTFRPFSHKTSGATTTIFQNLQYKTQRLGVTTRQSFIRRRAGVIFEHAYGHDKEDQSIRDAETKLGMICSETKEGIRPETPRLFSELVSIVRDMDAQALRDIYKKVKQGSICRDNIDRVKEFFLDSLPMATSSASVELMKELLLNKEVTSVKATMWITSLTFIHIPTRKMLEQVKEILQSPDYSKKSMLPISTMINNYCDHRESCSDDYAVTSIISAMEKVIGSGCYVKDSNLESTLLTLRALGNAGHLDSLTSTFSSCYSRQSNPIEVRVTAIQAYRRLSCSADRSTMLTTYQDGEEDSELRIAAYLAAMQCPTDDVLSTVQSTLENEIANQVGSFVWSHLTNLMETSSPQKQAIRRILEDLNLKREIDLEFLKYSRNYEGSLFLEKFNTGAMAESNVIFSEKSSLPRSAMLNMSVDLFGHSLNLFELGGRIEGLEYLFETYLEPLYKNFGGAKKPKMKVKLDDLKGDLYMRMFGNEMFYDHFKGPETLGKTKDVNVLDMLIKMTNKDGYSFTQSVIIMDSSMIIPTSAGMPLNLTVNGTASIDIQASGRVDFKQLTTSPRSMMIGGMVKPSGSIQFDGIMSMDAHVTKTGMRVVNTWHSSTALKGRVELSRGQILTAQLDFPENKMEIFDVKTEFFSLHGDEERSQELLKDNKKTIELCTGYDLAEITGVEICNEVQWTNASMKEDAPYFPFTGPFSQSLILYKRDTHTGYSLNAKQIMDKDEIVAQVSFNTPDSMIDRSIAFDFNFNKKQMELEMKLESPWKKADLRGSLDDSSEKVGMRGQLVVDDSSYYGVTSEIEITKAQDIVTLSPRLVIKRPGVKTISMSGQITMDGLKSSTAYLLLTGVRKNGITLIGTVMNTSTEKSVKGSISLAPKEVYSTEIGLVYQNSGRKNAITKIIPTVLVSTSQRDLVTITGSGQYRKWKSLKGGLTVGVYDVLDKPITVECNLKKSSGARERLFGTISVTSKFILAKVIGNVQKKGNAVSTSFTLNYDFQKIRSSKNKIKFSSKYIDRSTPTLWNHGLNVNFKNQINPEINFITDLGFALGKKHRKIDVSLNYGPTSNTSKRRIEAHGLINYALDRRAIVDYNLETLIGPLEIDIKLKGKHVHDRRSVDSSMVLEVQWSPYERLSMDASISAPSTENIDGSLRFTSHYDNLRDIMIKVSHKRERSDLVSIASLDYGAQKSAEFVSHIDIESLNKFSVSIKTPFDDYRSVEGSLEYNGNMNMFDGRATFGASPILGDFAGMIVWNIDANVRGKLRIDTPFKDLRYMQVYASSEKTYKGRQSRIETEYHPRQTISLDTTYTFNHPLAVDATLKTPFENMEHLSASLKHYLGRNSLQTQAGFEHGSDNYGSDLRLNWDRGLSGIWVVTTPIEGHEISKVSIRHEGEMNDWKSHCEMEYAGKKGAADVEFQHGYKTTGSFLLKTPIEGMEETKVSLNKRGPLNNLRGGLSVSYGRYKNIEVTMQNRLSGRRLDTTVLVESPFSDDIRFKIDHDGNIENFETKISGTVGSRGSFNSETTFNLRYPRINLSSNLEYTVDWRTRNIGLNVIKDGYLNDMSALVTGILDNDQIDATFKLKTKDGITGSVIVTTPFEGLERTNVKYSHVFGRYPDPIRQNAAITYGRDRREITSDISIQPFPDMKLNIDVRTPFARFEHSRIAASHDDRRGNCRSNLNMELMETRVNIDSTFRHGHSTWGSVFATTNIEGFESMKASFNKDGQFKSSASAGLKGWTIETSLNGRISDDIKGTFALKTPFKTLMMTSYEHTLRSRFMTVRSAITNARGERITLDINADATRNIDVNAVLKTPFKGYEMSGIGFTSSSNMNNFKSQVKMEFAKSRITAETEIRGSFRDTIQMAVNIKTPFNKFRNIGGSLKQGGDLAKFNSVGILRYMDGMIIEEAIKFSIKRSLLTINTELRTPFEGFERQELHYRYTVTGPYWNRKEGKIEVIYGRHRNKCIADFNLATGTDTYTSNDLRGELKIHTNDENIEDIKISVSKEGDLSDLKAVGMVALGNDHHYYGWQRQRVWSIEAKFRDRASINGEVKLLMDKKRIAVKLNHYNRGIDHIASYIEIDSPFQKLMKVEIQHTISMNEVNSNVMVQNRDKKLTAELHGSSSPKYAVDVTITTPFRRYKDLSAWASYTKGSGRYTAEGLLNAGNGYKFGAESTVDLSSSPITAVARVTSPSERYFDFVEVSLSHTGELRNFHTTGNLKSPMTGSLTGEATLNYRSPLEMEGSLILTGGVELVLQNSKRNEKHRSHAKFAWSQSQEITFESSCLITNHYGKTQQLITELVLTTPFDLMRQAALRYENRHASNKNNHIIEARYNRASVLDMDVELVQSPQNKGSVTMRQPKPMQLIFSGGTIDRTFDGEMFLNWDRDDPQSNIRVQTTVTDKSKRHQLDRDLAVKLIHPSNTVGIVGNLLHSQQRTKTRGELIWNEDAVQKIFLDVDMNHRGRRYSKEYDYTMKLGSSRRTLQMDGSYSDNGASRTLDGAFRWDADRDSTKQIGVNAVIIHGDSLRLSSIVKDIRFDSEMVLNSGRTLFNGKTEVSYSPDTRKTLTLISRLEDTSYGYGNTNYSFMVGISHPSTDVDIKMNSDIGVSSKEYTGGMNLVYLTSRKERKNFALRGEVNKLRKHIDVKMKTPMNNIELTGKVEENPFRLRVRNKYDDDIVQTYLTLDGSKRMVDFQTNYDLDNPSKILHMNAEFVNSTSAQAVLYHEGYSRVADTVIAVRLNTSRLLHTRIHWRQQMIPELQAFLSSEIKQYGGRVTRGMTTVYQAVEQEVIGKYHRITMFVSEEIASFQSLLENEMADIERGLDFINSYDAYKDFIADTKEVFATVNEKMAHYVEEMNTYPITQNYQFLLAEPYRHMKTLQKAVDKFTINSVEAVARLDNDLNQLQDNFFDYYNIIANKMKESMRNLKEYKVVETSVRISDNFQLYLNSLSQGVQDLKIIDKYKRVMDNARETMTSQLSNLTKTENLKHLLSLSNNAYQEGVWAFYYWQVEEKVENHLRRIPDILEEMVGEELLKYKNGADFLWKSRATVWDPEHGELQVELYLPIPLESLDIAPDVNAFVQRVKTVVSKYIPGLKTIQISYNGYIPAFMRKSKVTGETSAVQRIRPSRTLRRQHRIPRYYDWDTYRQ